MVVYGIGTYYYTSTNYIYSVVILDPNICQLNIIRVFYTHKQTGINKRLNYM